MELTGIGEKHILALTKALTRFTLQNVEGFRLHFEPLPATDTDFTQLDHLLRQITPHPDLILIDDTGYNLDIIATKILHRLSDVKLIFITNRVHVFKIWVALEAGFMGFIYLSDGIETELRKAIEKIEVGNSHLSPTAANIFENRAGRTGMTRTQRRILLLMLDNYSVMDIAHLMTTTPEGIYSQQHRMRRMFGVETNEQLLHIFAENTP